MIVTQYLAGFCLITLGREWSCSLADLLKRMEKLDYVCSTYFPIIAIFG